MQVTSGPIWWLELLKILSPIAATLVLGLWLSRKTEKYKNDLAKEINHFQTRDSLLHQKQAEVIEQLYSHVTEFEDSLRAITITLFNAYDMDVHALNQRIAEQLQGLRKASEQLTRVFHSKQILLDKETCTIFNEVHAPLLEAETNLCVVFLKERNVLNVKEASAQERMDQSIEIVFKTLPALKTRLEKRFREILSPFS